jgi:hypothetical protein
MATIGNDRDLRNMLRRLSPEQQRRIGGMFIESAVDLCDDSRVRRAARVAMDPAASEEDRADAFHSAKAYAVSTYTECGREVDWNSQAAHFLGVAAACLLSDEVPDDEANRAWQVAMQVRNARNCALITHEGERDMDDESERQRQIATDYADG